MHISDLKATAAAEGEGGERTRRVGEKGGDKEVDMEDRTAMVAVEEIGRTEARKGKVGARNKDSLGSPVKKEWRRSKMKPAANFVGEETEKRRKWRRGRKNREMSDGFPSPATERLRGSSRGGERDRRSRNEKRQQGGRRSTATWSRQRMRRRKRGEEI